MSLLRRWLVVGAVLRVGLVLDDAAVVDRRSAVRVRTASVRMRTAQVWLLGRVL